MINNEVAFAAVLEDAKRRVELAKRLPREANRENMRVFPRYEGEPPRISDLKRRGYAMNDAIRIAAMWDQMTPSGQIAAVPSLGQVVRTLP